MSYTKSYISSYQTWKDEMESTGVVEANGSGTTGYHVSKEEIVANHVQAAADRPNGTAQQNKSIFDKLTEYFINKYNEALTAIETEFGIFDTALTNMEASIKTSLDNFESEWAAYQASLTGSGGTFEKFENLVQSKLTTYETTANQALTQANTAVTTANKAAQDVADASKYVWFVYSAYEDGRDFVQEPTNTSNYLGIATTNDKVCPTVATDFTWVRFRGHDGAGTGDMVKATYDPDDNGIVTEAERATYAKDGTSLLATQNYTLGQVADAERRIASDISDVNTSIETAKTEAKTYADTQDATNLTAAKTYADAQDATNLTAAKSYAYSKAQTDSLISGFKNISSSTINIPVATWDATNLNCTVTASGVTADNAVVVTPDPASMDAYSAAGIVCTAQAAGTLTFTCKTVPTAAVAVSIMVVG